MPRQQTELVVWSWARSVISGCCWRGRSFLFLEGSWQVDGEGFLACKKKIQDNDDSAYMLPIFPVIHLGVSLCLHLSYIPLPLSLSLSLSLSLCLSSSGLIRAGLWREGEMVTVTTAENDGQSGRALCVCLCVCVWSNEVHNSIQYHICIVQNKSQKVGSLYSFLMYNKSWKFSIYFV